MLTTAVVPLGKELYSIAPVCCADGYTTVLLCRVLFDRMSYQGTAEKQYFYTEQSSLLINPLINPLIIHIQYKH